MILLLLAALLPDPTLTPGDVEIVSLAAVCRPGYATKARAGLTDRVKRQVYVAYGITPAGRFRISAAGDRVWQSDYEVDHLVSLELAGSNDPSNLWIQSYRLKTYNARWKDALENRLHWLVCHGKMDLATAQAALMTDWPAAYDTYVQ